MFHQFAPVAGRVDVDFDHAGVGRDLQHFQARVARWRVAFEHDGQAQCFGAGFDGSEQVEVVFEAFLRRHEDIQRARFAFAAAVGGGVGVGFGLGVGAVGAGRVAHFDAQRGAGQPSGGFKGFRDAVIHWRGRFVRQGGGGGRGC